MKRRVFHPILFAISPLLSLYITNYSRVSLQDIWRSLVIAVLIASIFWYCLFRLIHNNEKAALIISVVVFVYFSFHSLLWANVQLFSRFEKLKDALLRYETRLGLTIWAMICVLLTGFVIDRILRAKRDLGKLTQFLNIISFCLMINIGFTWFNAAYKPSAEGNITASAYSAKWISQIDREPTTLIQTTESLPDIYYIILDGYARDDTLSNYYDMDNSAFLNFLRDNGFYVAREARTNYMHTNLSLSSSLNSIYLDDIVETLGANSEDASSLKTLIAYNQAFKQLRGIGYKVVTFSTDFWYTNIDTGDQKYSVGTNVNNYESLLINNTPLSVPLFTQQYRWHREKIDYAFDTIPNLDQDTAPKFVFAHIFAPHPPFVYDQEGNSIYPNWLFSISDGSDFYDRGSVDEYITGYRDQLTYINQKVEALVTEILAGSDTPPIIIIQGDHGPGSMLDQFDLEKTNLAERMTILNAYFLPGLSETGLYPSISPINTFPLIFNDYFGGNYTLVEDRSYYSPNLQPFNLTEVTDQIPMNTNP